MYGRSLWHRHRYKTVFSSNRERGRLERENFGFKEKNEKHQKVLPLFNTQIDQKEKEIHWSLHLLTLLTAHSIVVETFTKFIHDNERNWSRILVLLLTSLQSSFSFHLFLLVICKIRIKTLSQGHYRNNWSSIRLSSMIDWKFSARWVKQIRWFKPLYLGEF